MVARDPFQQASGLSFGPKWSQLRWPGCPRPPGFGTSLQRRRLANAAREHHDWPDPRVVVVAGRSLFAADRGPNRAPSGQMPVTSEPGWPWAARAAGQRPRRTYRYAPSARAGSRLRGWSGLSSGWLGPIGSCCCRLHGWSASAVPGIFQVICLYPASPAREGSDRQRCTATWASARLSVSLGRKGTRHRPLPARAADVAATVCATDAAPQ
jgi:hypothetical protein